VVPWQAPGTGAKKRHTNDQGFVDNKAMSISHPPWARDGQNSEETVPLAQNLFTVGRSTHLLPTIQEPGHQNQDFSADTEEIEPVDQINAELTSSIDGGSTLNGAPSFIERGIPRRLILHTSPKKQSDSHSSIPSEMLESGGSGIDKMQLDGDSGCVEDASLDNELASGSEYTASENL
jgi:hypothetical protein